MRLIINILSHPYTIIAAAAVTMTFYCLSFSI